MPIALLSNSTMWLVYQDSGVSAAPSWYLILKLYWCKPQSFVLPFKVPRIVYMCLGIQQYVHVQKPARSINSREADIRILKTGKTLLWVNIKVSTGFCFIKAQVILISLHLLCSSRSGRKVVNDLFFSGVPLIKIIQGQKMRLLGGMVV